MEKKRRDAGVSWSPDARKLGGPFMSSTLLRRLPERVMAAPAVRLLRPVLNGWLGGFEGGTEGHAAAAWRPPGRGGVGPARLSIRMASAVPNDSRRARRDLPPPRCLAGAATAAHFSSRLLARPAPVCLEKSIISSPPSHSSWTSKVSPPERVKACTGVVGACALFRTAGLSRAGLARRRRCVLSRGGCAARARAAAWAPRTTS